MKVVQIIAWFLSIGLMSYAIGELKTALKAATTPKIFIDSTAQNACVAAHAALCAAFCVVGIAVRLIFL